MNRRVTAGPEKWPPSTKLGLSARSNFIKGIFMPGINDVVVRKPTKEEFQMCQSWPIWTCDVSRFDYSYDEKETCLILEGQVTVSDRAGTKSVTFSPGDLVVFPEGLDCTWTVAAPVRKHYNFG
jgi:uncharacterized protein